MGDPAIFLTGTGTGVGKTVVGCALALRWAAEGRGPRVYKPAESGCESKGESLYPADAAALKAAAGDGRPLNEICPYRYALPMAPAHAAEEEGNPPDIAKIVNTICELRSRPGPLLVEGAGGLLVPLGPGARMSDVARRCGLDILIVAPLGLGTLNDTQMTVRVARDEGLAIAGIILNDLTGTESPSARRNPSAIEELCDAPLLGVFPHISGLESEMKKNMEKGSIAVRRLSEAMDGVGWDLIG
jgi:dethiobiotin synthetase